MSQDTHTSKHLIAQEKKEAHIQRYDTMCKRFSHISEVGCESEHTTENILEQLQRMENLDTCTRQRKNVSSNWGHSQSM